MATIIVGRKPEAKRYSVKHRYSAIELETAHYTREFIQHLQDRMTEEYSIPKDATFTTKQDDDNINFYQLVAEWWEIEIPD